MKHLRDFMICLAMLMASPFSFAVPDRGTPDEAVAMVKKVIADMKKSGKEKVIQDIQNKSTRYLDRDLYVSIGTLDGVTVANGQNPRIAGKNVIEMKDMDGKYVNKERIEIAKTKGQGWLEFKWPDPVSKEMGKKSMYVERYEDLQIGCGIYKD